MDGSDVHLGETGHLTESFPTAGDYSILQLCGGLVSECERNDVAGSHPSPCRRKEIHYTPSDDLRLPRTGAGDELKILSVVDNGASLIAGQIHTGRQVVIPRNVAVR